VVKNVVAAGVSALALLLVPGVASAHKHASSPSIKPFVVYGVYTREQRSELVSEGYDIGEASWADHVELFGSDQQALALTLRGFRVFPKAEPTDFPPEDSGYHNYAETVADLQAVAAAHPAIVHLFSLGTSYEGRELIGARTVAYTHLTLPTTERV
jgi:carboxypeptidase T